MRDCVVDRLQRDLEAHGAAREAKARGVTLSVIFGEAWKLLQGAHAHEDGDEALIAPFRSTHPGRRGSPSLT